MKKIKSINELYNYLASLNQNMLLCQYDIVDAINANLYDDAPLSLEENYDGVECHHYIKNMEECGLVNLDTVNEDEMYEILSQWFLSLDFEDPKFIHFGNAHGNCDCPLCKNHEYMLEENDYFDEDIDEDDSSKFSKEDMLNYLGNAVKSFNSPR